jgi:hypothetical protein
MTKPSENVTLYGDKAEQFREVREELTAILGHEPTNAEVVGVLMAGWDPGEPLPAEPAQTR